MPKKEIAEEPEETEEAPVKLTKKGQKPRQFTEEHLEKLKLAREKARETQQRNKEIRQMEKENKAEEERKRKEAIIAKNKEIKSSLKKVPNKPSDKPSALAKVETQEERVSDPPAPDDADDEGVKGETPERLERTANADKNASVVGEDYEENIKIIKKEKPKKKTKKPIVIVEQSESSESEDEQQVVYVKKKSSKYKKVQLPPGPPPPDPPPPPPEPVRQPYRPHNPFYSINYRNF